MNPAYGSGNTRRRIRLSSGPGRVEGLLTGISHQMRCTLYHDGIQVTSIEGEKCYRRLLRICAGADSQRRLSRQQALG